MLLTNKHNRKRNIFGRGKGKMLLLSCCVTTWCVHGSADGAGGGRGKKMEGNRDEAEKCLNIASRALEAGEKEKALKFLNKAEKLYPTDRAKGNDI